MDRLDPVDYIVDAIDTVSAKIAIVQYAKEKSIPIISSMGTGNKLHGELFEIADLSKTSMCPLCKVMRKELKNSWDYPFKSIVFKRKTNRYVRTYDRGRSGNEKIGSREHFFCSACGRTFDSGRSDPQSDRGWAERSWRKRIGKTEGETDGFI